MSRRTISDDGVAFIKAHEGLRRRAAPLPDGGWLIGHSHVAENLEGEEITPMVAEARLRTDLEPIEDAIDELVYAPLSQTQYDALVSFGFSIGLEAFRGCGVAERLNEGHPIEAVAVFDIWRQARVGERVTYVDALVRRRAAEKALFLEVEGGPVPAPSALVRPVADPVAARGAVSDTPLDVHVDMEGARVRILTDASIRRPVGPPGDVIHRVRRILSDWVAPAEVAPDRIGDAATDTAADLGAGVERPPSGAAPSLSSSHTFSGARAVTEFGGAPTFKRGWSGEVLADLVPAMPAWMERWPWMLAGLGVVLAATGVTQMRLAGDASVAQAAELAWTVATVSGVLALAAAAYHGARRIAGFADE